MGSNEKFLSYLAFSLIIFCSFSKNLFSEQRLEDSLQKYTRYDAKLDDCSRGTIFDGQPGSFTLKPWDEIEKRLKADCLVPIEEEPKTIKEAEGTQREIIEKKQEGDFAKYYDFIYFLKKLGLAKPSGTRYSFVNDKRLPYFRYRTDFRAPLYFVVLVKRDRFEIIRKIVEYRNAGKISPMFSELMIGKEKYKLYLVNTTDPSYLVDALFFQYSFSISFGDSKPHLSLDFEKGEGLFFVPAKKIPKVQFAFNFIGKSISTAARINVPMNMFMTEDSIKSFLNDICTEEDVEDIYDQEMLGDIMLKFKVWFNLGVGRFYWAEFQTKN